MRHFGKESARQVNWLLKLLGYRDNEYRGSDFSVRIESLIREGVSIVHTRQATTLNLSGERIGRKWEGIEVHIPQDVGPAQVTQIVRDLEIAFLAMRYSYVIARNTGIDVVPETERQAAISELNEMGYEVEMLPDGNIRPTRKVGVPRYDVEKLRNAAPRTMSLIKSLHGTRRPFEILAKSKGH